MPVDRRRLSSTPAIILITGHCRKSCCNLLLSAAHVEAVPCHLPSSSMAATSKLAQATINAVESHRSSFIPSPLSSPLPMLCSPAAVPPPWPNHHGHPLSQLVTTAGLNPSPSAAELPSHGCRRRQPAATLLSSVGHEPLPEPPVFFFLGAPNTTAAHSLLPA